MFKTLDTAKIPKNMNPKEVDTSFRCRDVVNFIEREKREENYPLIKKKDRTS